MYYQRVKNVLMIFPPTNLYGEIKVGNIGCVQTVMKATSNHYAVTT